MAAHPTNTSFRNQAPSGAEEYKGVLRCEHDGESSRKRVYYEQVNTDGLSRNETLELP